MNNEIGNDDKKYQKYINNLPHIRKYQNRKYNEDPDFRNKKLELSSIYHKNRYATDENYRQNIKDNVKKYRQRIKEEKLLDYNLKTSQ